MRDSLNGCSLFLCIQLGTEDTKKSGSDYSLYFYSIDHEQKQPMSPLVGARAKEKEIHADAWGWHILRYAFVNI